jgi:hypothetical protein
MVTSGILRTTRTFAQPKNPNTASSETNLVMLCFITQYFGSQFPRTSFGHIDNNNVSCAL